MVTVIQGDQGVPALSTERETVARDAIEVVVDEAPAVTLPDYWPASAKLLLDGSVILTLEQPVQFKLRDADGTIRDGTRYERLHMQRLKGEHKKKQFAAKDAYELELYMFGASAQLDAGKADLLYRAMDQADITAANRVIRFFTTPGQKTGSAV